MHRQLTLGLAATEPRDARILIDDQAALLTGFALENQSETLQEIERVIAQAPFRNMLTPGGRRMSVAMTNCGSLGWVTDKRGYRYQSTDPLTEKPWPSLPTSLLKLATRAAAETGFEHFMPDACLVNQYSPGAQMTLHQDKDERDFNWPVVSLSLGLPATFLFGGDERSDKAKRFPLEHGDVVVWGGKSRLKFHGILPLKDGEHPLLGRRRINLTFRMAA